MGRTRVLVGCAAAMGSAALSVLGGAPASAESTPNVVGQKFSDASSTLTSAGSTPIVDVTVGDMLPRSECIVTRQQDRTAEPPPNSSGSATKETLLSLDCYAPLAHAGLPGNSLESPQGRAEAAAEASAAASASASASASATPAPAR